MYVAGVTLTVVKLLAVSVSSVSVLSSDTSPLRLVVWIVNVPVRPVTGRFRSTERVKETVVPFGYSAGLVKLTCTIEQFIHV
eukprot:2053527-Rhodomonas_salina.1